MTTPLTVLGRGKAAALVASTLFFLATPALARQVTPSETQPAAGIGWQAWVGCWEPIESRAPGSAISDIATTPIEGTTTAGNTTPKAAPTASAATQMMCVLPTIDGQTVEIATVIAGQIAERLTMTASGKQDERTLEGCTGWESATWADAAPRIYTRSRYTCAGDIERHSTGVLAMAPGGQWFDVQSVTVGGRTATRALRYRAARPANDPVELSPEIAAALASGQTLSARTSRLAAAVPLTIADVIEAAQYLDTPTLEAWLVEQAQGFAVNADELLAMADANVPDDVIDLVVALSYPSAFAIDRAPHETGFNVAEAPQAQQPGGPQNPADRYRDPFGYHFPSGYYGYGSSFYSPFGYSPYGYGGYGYGWYPGGRTVVIVREPAGDGDKSERRRGQAVKGRGYTRGGRSGATPDGARGRGEPTRNMTPATGAGSRNTTPDQAGSGAGNNAGSTTRTAKPRGDKTGT